MSNTIQTRFSLGNQSELTTPTSTREYPIGHIVELYDDVNDVSIAKYIYIYSHGALTQYQPYVLAIGSTAGQEVQTAAPFTLAAPGLIVCVPQVAFTANYYGFVLIQGDGKVLMTAETYAVGDHLQVLNGGTALVVDGSTGSTTYTVNTCGICKEAGTTAVARDLYLFNRQSVCAAT
jgi:hypothetical protein